MRWARLGMPAAGLAVLLAACSYTAGSGTLRTESRDVKGFSAVAVAGTGDVLIQQTGSESLTIEAEENLLPLLTSDVSGGVLTLATKPSASINPTRPITYRVTMKDLSGLSVSGSATVTAGQAKTASLLVQISGSGIITVDGTSDAQEVRISGSGDYRGSKLTSRTATVQITGSGNASIMVSDRLDVQVSGSGTLAYSGNPQVTQSVSGSGKIVKQ
ncbi:MAG: head GIN domain-containing protein [Dermatophilaceae bacterium]